MPGMKPKSPSAAAFDGEFVEKSIKLRGKTYVFRELDVAAYDELVNMSTSQNDQGEELIDQGLLRKLMTVKSCISERLPDGLATMPMRLANKLSLVAQEVNYGLEPDETDEKEDPIQEGEPDDEGEG